MSSRQVTRPTARATRVAAPTRAQAPAPAPQMPAKLNADSARVAPGPYMQAASHTVAQQALPVPQYSPASAADFSACQLPQPIQIKVPQVTVRRHQFPIVYTTYDRVVNHELIEVPVQYQKVENPVVEHNICNIGAQQQVDTGSVRTGWGNCNKSSFNPNQPVVEATQGNCGAASTPYQYGSYSGSIY